MRHLMNFNQWHRLNEELSGSGPSGTFKKKGKDEWDYAKIEASTDPRALASLIFHSIWGPGNDQEAAAEAAFIALAKNGSVKIGDIYFYDEVARIIPNPWRREAEGKYKNGVAGSYIDPYTWIKGEYAKKSPIGSIGLVGGIDTSKVYHKQSIDNSRKKCKSVNFPDSSKTYDIVYFKA